MTHDLAQRLTGELARFLQAQLPALADDWWQELVVTTLAAAPREWEIDPSVTALEQLHLVALLRVMERNWQALAAQGTVPWAGLDRYAELNGCSDLGGVVSAAGPVPPDADRATNAICGLLRLIGAEAAVIEQAEREWGLAEVADAGSSLATLAPAESPEPAGAGPRFKPGELVTLRSDSQTQAAILEVLGGGVEARYRCMVGGEQRFYYEQQLAPVAPAGPPQPTAGELQAQLASWHLLSPSVDRLYSVRLGRVDFEPYQYRPVLKMIRSDRQRLLIADEVGVGKTIEAGLILQELRARSEIQSVLILCPKALVAENKWKHEMARFGEHFMALDGPTLRQCVSELHLNEEWPEPYRNAIVPFSLLDKSLLSGSDGRRGRRGLEMLDSPPRFDLLIVDEAHHIRNTNTQVHKGVQFFCEHADAVLMLTATPVQMGRHDLFVLLRTLRPDLILDEASFQQMAEPNEGLHRAVQLCRRRADRWEQEALAALEEVAATPWGQTQMRGTPEFRAILYRLAGAGLSDRERVRLIRDLEDQYTFRPLINRTRRRDIGEFTTRSPVTVEVEFTPAQRALHDGVLEFVANALRERHGRPNVAFMMSTLRRQAASCLFGLAPLLGGMLRGYLDQVEGFAIDEEAPDLDEDAVNSVVDKMRQEMEALLAQAEQLLETDDPKTEALIQALHDNAARGRQKAMLFSTFRHTLAWLEPRIVDAGFRVGVIHGEVADEERRDLRQRFALPPDDPEAIDVLLSSEVGCEGLDFQFCDFLINYDLPWNPMRIEQRIGRIDRRGQQSETVVILNLITSETVDAEIYHRCLGRLGIFERVVGGSEEILGEIRKELRDIAEDFELSLEEKGERLQQLADNQIWKIQVIQQLEEAEAELLGLELPRDKPDRELAEATSVWLTPVAIERCVSAYLNHRLGKGEHLLGGSLTKTLRLNQEARSKLLNDFQAPSHSQDQAARAWKQWLQGAEPHLAVTFDQETAREDPKLVHLSVLHPLVRQAARHLEGQWPVTFNVEAPAGALPAGRYPYAVYRWSYRGGRPDDKLIVVAGNPAIEDAAMGLLAQAKASVREAPLTAAERQQLEAGHHARWLQERARYRDDSRLRVAQQKQSLKTSYAARHGLLEEQLTQATDDRIRRMREAEKRRLEADYQRRLAKLDQQETAADLEGTEFISGVIVCGEEGRNAE